MLETRLIADELMDDPALDEGTYREVLYNLARVNRITMAFRPTLSFLDRAIGSRRKFRLLDVGYGDGAMLRAIAEWAAKRGIEGELVGIDLNPRSAQAAREATVDIAIDYLMGDYADLAGRGWDFITSNLVAHHMTHDQLIAFLRFMSVEAAAGWLINDLNRSGLAYVGYPMLSRLMRWHPIVRHDGRMSIARSYRLEEWLPMLEEAGITEARAYRAFPFRLCVERIR